MINYLPKGLVTIAALMQDIPANANFCRVSLLEVALAKVAVVVGGLVTVVVLIITKYYLYC
jgi:hypothetical protein